MRKIILSLALAAVVGLGFISSANAQVVDTSGVDCGVLTNSPFACVKNLTDQAIKAGIPVAPRVVVGIQAISGNVINPNAWIRLNQPIMPGKTTIVKFGTYAGGCNQHIVILLSDGSNHVYPYTDVCKATSFLVLPW